MRPMPTDKKDKMRQTREANEARRKTMQVRTFEVKVDNSKLSREKKEHFAALFREAKWLRNDVVASENPFTYPNTKIRSVSVKVGDVFEDRVLATLSSQMKQSIVFQVHTDINNLSAKKEKGQGVGKLKFKSIVNTIPLVQFDHTYRIDFKNKTITIQGLRKAIKVNGLHQIPEDAEIANAKFIRKPSGYYFHITVYLNAEPTEYTGLESGVDYGFENHLTYSDGTTINISVPESKGVKLASRRVNKSLKRNGNNKKSKKHQKRKHNLRRAYEKNTNKKQDLANKAVHYTVTTYDFIGMQDEMIAGWHKGLFGRQVQHSALGFIKRKLKKNSKVHVVPSSFPSTQKCPDCGLNTKHPLGKRDYECQYCGYYHPSRDVKAAQMILAEAVNQIDVGDTHLSPVEVRTSATDHSMFSGKFPPLKQEASDFSQG